MQTIIIRLLEFLSFNADNLKKFKTYAKSLRRLDYETIREVAHGNINNNRFF